MQIFQGKTLFKTNKNVRIFHRTIKLQIKYKNVQQVKRKLRILRIKNKINNPL